MYDARIQGFQSHVHRGRSRRQESTYCPSNRVIRLWLQSLAQESGAAEGFSLLAHDTKLCSRRFLGCVHRVPKELLMTPKERLAVVSKHTLVYQGRELCNVTSKEQMEAGNMSSKMSFGDFMEAYEVGGRG